MFYTFISFKWVSRLLLSMMIVSCMNPTTPKIDTMKMFHWSTLPAIPDSFGFAGGFVGVSHQALLFAGGANFPDGLAPWTGGVKKWHQPIFVLESLQSDWKKVGELPIPLGYGVSITHQNKLIIIGGSHEKGHTNQVFSLEYLNGAMQIDSLPSLPMPLANSVGALVGDIIYVAGGLVNDTDKQTTSIFISLDLKNLDKGWQILEPYPGKSRMLSVAAVYKDQFFLFSGTSLENGQREYLVDAYSYDSNNGWNRLPDLPYPVVAAPSMAYTKGDNIYIFGGDNGELAPKASELKEHHPGFETKILQFNFKDSSWSFDEHIQTDIKSNAATHPNESTWAPVTTSLVVWNDQIVIPSGEVRPAIRTPKVLTATVH